MDAVMGSTKYQGDIAQGSTSNVYVSTLPPNVLPFEQFAKDFSLGGASTEQSNPLTKGLSQAMHRNIQEGLEMLVRADEKVLEGLEKYISMLPQWSEPLAERMAQGGRVFLVGSGSSGRVAVDVAAKCANKQVYGIIAGGDSAVVRAKEGFEDSEKDGAKALEEYHLTALDTVILISASGSASFNVGCGHEAANRGANVLYFYNSENVPERTQKLFTRQNNPVIPMCVDIGPQAISGSTRLQGATLAEAALGSLLGSVLHPEEDYPGKILRNMEAGLAQIRSSLGKIEAFAKKEAEILSSPEANLRKVKDVLPKGYMTFLSEESIREVLIDATETPPTFCTNHIQRETAADAQKKRAEFRAYSIGKGDNREAWQTLVGREIAVGERENTEQFLLAAETSGIHSYENRPKGEGNLVIGVAKLKETEEFSEKIMRALNDVKKEGGETGAILLYRGKIPEETWCWLNMFQGPLLVLEDVAYDEMGFSETLLLKQILNLISNSSMVLVNKVYGNQMIDVRAANNKLIDRCMRLVKEIFLERGATLDCSNEMLYHYITHLNAMRKVSEEQGIYTPSIVKIAVAMLALQKTPADFDEVVQYLMEKGESIDWV